MQVGTDASLWPAGWPTMGAPDLLRLCLDSGNLAFAGADPEAVFVEDAPRI